ncbi:Uncharacterised protein [Vibrio cholerae]|nr:Uncharacterised protein [Vibrio cholerae]CSB33092.1 Uncharacterised protein [Vibrio cholerae]CSB35173.1 Uncharacterised protein [Vibrio cholerae]CSB56600.1 Uncharacterised protein [Vibrio cholerae]CSC39312.1 Uncharacterised protein [Vibrio cholerae]
MHRILFDVRQAIVHPAHVPLKTKPEAAHKGRGRNTGESRRFFGNRHRIREVFVYLLVHPFEGSNRIVVFASTVNIRDPLIMATRIIEIEHRCDRINTNAIDMEHLKPIQRISD